MCLSLLLWSATLLKRDSNTVCKISENTQFEEYLQTTASGE